MSLRRNLFAAALVAVVALPSAALAQRATTTTRTKTATTSSTSTTAAPSLSIGGGIGFESGLGDTGPTLRVDGVYPLQNLTPEVTMAIVGTLGYTHYGQSAYGVDASTNIFKILPAVRFGYGVNPKVSVYGDAGLGLYYWKTKVDINYPGFDNSDSGVGLMMKFAAGALYEVAPRLQVGADIGLNPYFGDIGDTSFTLTGVVLYKL